MVNIIAMPEGAEKKRLVSPAFSMTRPEVWHADKIPSGVIQILERHWQQASFPACDVTISVIHNAVVADEGLVFTESLQVLGSSTQGYSADQIERVSMLVQAGLESETLVRAEGTVVLCKKRGATNYGHWTMEMLPKAFVVRQLWPQGLRYMVHAVSDPLRGIIRESLAKLGIGQQDLIEVGPGPVRVESLVLVDGLSSHGSYMSPLVMDCVATVSADIPPKAVERLCVFRDGARSRRFVGEDEIRAIAIRCGYHLVDPTNMPFAEQIACFKGARRIVGVMGAAMTNIAFASPGAEVINLTPSCMSDTFFWFISGLRGLHYTEVRCEQLPPIRGPMPWDTDLLLTLEDRNRIFHDPETASTSCHDLVSEGVGTIEADEIELDTPDLAEFDIVAHVKNVGDVRGGLADWVGRRGSQLWLEGFGITPDGDIMPEEIEYQAVLDKNRVSAWVAGGIFCGTRGKGLPIYGIGLRLRGAAAAKYSCSYLARFIDGTEVGPTQFGLICTLAALIPLEALRITLSPRLIADRAESVATD
jgi:capsular polysaccharide biosynthesis protein